MSFMKGSAEICGFLNTGDRSYEVMLNKLAGKEKLIQNTYEIDRKNYEIRILNTVRKDELPGKRSSNPEEFFEVIHW